LPLKHLYLPCNLLRLPFDLRHPRSTTTAPIPRGAYTISPHYFDPAEIRNAITGQTSTSCIPVFLPNSSSPIHS
ncbi:hypothetical protein ALC56_09912, partial [Trachymyrmex septentrionalis]